MDGVRLISLQKPDDLPPSDCAEAPWLEQMGPDFDAGADAFVDTAALMANLDLIVTCDTSIAHLAGALGAPVWVALKQVAEWRWLCDRADSPWYPTMRLFRQRTRGDWNELLARTASALEPLVKRGDPPIAAKAIAIPGAVGELIDKITILEIKSERIPDAGKLQNVRSELGLLHALQADEGLDRPPLDVLRTSLKAVNAELWEIEDDIRICEKNDDFGPSFIALARAVYRLNDKRAALKLEINRLFGSAIVEEKSYA
jgi:Family of unknown function (DUF6165)